MTIHVIHKNFGDKFYELLSATNQEINIISPFIGESTAEALAKWLEELEDVKCRIITKFAREEFVQGASSVYGLKRLIEAGAKCYALQDLHTKLYLFDYHSVIMGSANFTFNGFYKNHEFGFYMEEESAFTQECMEYFQCMLEKVKEWEITKERINQEIKYVNDARHRRQAKKDTKEYNVAKWGAKLIDVTSNPKQIEKEKDFLEEVIQTVSFNKDTGIWLKFEGTSEKRIDNEEVYLNRRKNHYEVLDRTFFPVQPSGIKEGDTIFLATVSYNEAGHGVPIIVGYANTRGFKRENVISKDDATYQPWNAHFKYFIELVDGKFLKSKIKHGISLKDVCYDLQHKLYPTTINKPETKVESVVKRHYQKSHLQITSAAKEYLIQQLEKRFEQHGYDTLNV